MALTLRDVWRWLPGWVVGVRAVSLGVFLVTTFSVTLSSTSILALLVFIVSIYGVNTNPAGQDDDDKTQDSWDLLQKNPLKGKPPHQTCLSKTGNRKLVRPSGTSSPATTPKVAPVCSCLSPCS